MEPRIVRHDVAIRAGDQLSERPPRRVPVEHCPEADQSVVPIEVVSELLRHVAGDVALGPVEDDHRAFGVMRSDDLFRITHDAVVVLDVDEVTVRVVDSGVAAVDGEILNVVEILEAEILAGQHPDALRAVVPDQFRPLLWEMAKDWPQNDVAASADDRRDVHSRRLSSSQPTVWSRYHQVNKRKATVSGGSAKTRKRMIPASAPVIVHPARLGASGDSRLPRRDPWARSDPRAGEGSGRPHRPRW